jgi:hypothetical protein
MQGYELVSEFLMMYAVGFGASFILGYIKDLARIIMY